jgi:hypothetical protein
MLLFVAQLPYCFIGMDASFATESYFSKGVQAPDAIKLAQ